MNHQSPPGVVQGKPGVPEHVVAEHPIHIERVVGPDGHSFKASRTEAELRKANDIGARPLDDDLTPRRGRDVTSDDYDVRTQIHQKAKRSAVIQKDLHHRQSGSAEERHHGRVAGQDQAPRTGSDLVHQTIGQRLRGPEAWTTKLSRTEKG